MKLLSFAAAAALAAAALPASAAALVNGGFEAGLNGWTAGGPGSVITDTSVQDQDGALYIPTQGAAMAILTAGGPDDTTLSQAFSLSGAATLSFDWAFLGFDDTDHDDTGFVEIFDSQNNAVGFFQQSISTVDQGNSTGWLHQTVSLGAGAYTFVAGVRDVGDDPTQPFAPGFDSQVLLDNVQIAAGAVPEPASWALMIVGFASLGGALRARRSAAQAA